ncbi:MAG: YlmC/YmxH family sporulation protein [Ruminococcaceae bacterium]|nr:YlmC/YmxH family sporulation protein [Oscillospiraceae bacterium]
MERFSTCELREKEVVNICDGARLGCPSDFEFNVCDGRITALIVPRGCGFLGFGRDDIIIPWCKIECIGSDTILVKLSPEEYRQREIDKKKKKSFW